MVRYSTIPGFFAACGPATSIGRLPQEANGVVAGPVQAWHWGGAHMAQGDTSTIVLSNVCRETGGAVENERVAHLLQTNPAALTRLLPPFAAACASPKGVVVVADSMGFRHIFHRDPKSEGTPLIASSSLVAGQAIDADLDRTAVAVQGFLGWQLGQRTLFEGITKLEPGAVAYLGSNGIRITPSAESEPRPVSLREAVHEAAALLRRSLTSLLDDQPDAVLQLTGGMDSRLLLSAIPVNRRRGLKAMTLRVPGSDDARIAGAIAERYGIKHEVHGLSDIQGIDPVDAWDRSVAEAKRLDAMADPIALAAQRIAEQRFDQGVRISGLGGEVARGFYYLGRVRDRSYSRSDVERLASWRMFVNEAVEPELLTPEFASWARKAAFDQVDLAMRAGGDEWFRAADRLYLRDRMQRWAGATDVAVSNQRVVVNPMLDVDFLDIAQRLTPSDKARSRFLARLQIELDVDLARIPLDGRPAPIAYADPPVWQSALNAINTGKRAAQKTAQRLKRVNRPPAGGAVLAGKVVQHWRQHPEILDGLASLDMLRADWLERVLAGRVDPRPSSVAFLTNCLVAVSRSS